jgi:polyhydroxyalkanoate synthesis regulator phasin
MCFGSRVSPAFDTHELVKRLTASGFTAEQAEVVLAAMKQASEQYANTADSIYPTKIEMIEKNLAYKADFAAMKSDLVLMLKQDVALLKNEIHKV